MITEALVVQEPGAAFQYADIQVNDDLRENEVLVGMKATGVCHTDLNFRNEMTLPGLHPAVFGHEGKNLQEFIDYHVLNQVARNEVRGP
jgi:aryl-alcohol dehydrogenase